MVSVTISQGKLKGGEAVSENGFKYYEFLNIPYAKPPIGDLRFKSPQPPETWEGERDATKSTLQNTSCQKNLMTGEVTGSEDCLYLNVYTPKITSDGTNTLPVMVYIHGGGFIYGNGTIKEEASPEFLLENDVVVVSINYRLGVLGFLSLDIPEVSGNMGLKDQVKALEWVQNNINKFGGDKNNVTIFGISAGSASVEFQILSPMSKGLFHKAILQSGSTLNDWAIGFEYDKLARNLADKLEYKGDKSDTRALYEFFLKVPAAELADAGFFVTEHFTAKSVFFGFVPIVEKNQDGAFLTSNPYQLLKEGNFMKVPVIRGFCELEGSLMNMMKPFAVKDLIDNKSFVNFWSYQLDDDDKEKYDNKFTAAYLDAAKPDDEHDKFAVNFFGDLHFSAGIWLSALFAAKHGIPQYVYKFTYDGKLNCFKNVFGLMMKGTAHGDDLGFIFKSNLIKAQFEEADLLFRAKITKLWTTFAKTGNPNPRESSTEGWPIFSQQSKAHAILDKQVTIERDYEPDRTAIFEEIYKKYEK